MWLVPFPISDSSTTFQSFYIPVPDHFHPSDSSRLLPFYRFLTISQLHSSMQMTLATNQRHSCLLCQKVFLALYLKPLHLPSFSLLNLPSELLPR